MLSIERVLRQSMMIRIIRIIKTSYWMHERPVLAPEKFSSFFVLEMYEKRFNGPIAVSGRKRERAAIYPDNPWSLNFLAKGKRLRFTSTREDLGKETPEKCCNEVATYCTVSSRRQQLASEWISCPSFLNFRRRSARGPPSSICSC